MVASRVDKTLLDGMVTNTGESVLDWSYSKPVLLVFLRHFGCTFCREALADISKVSKEIEAMGTKIIFVHMTTSEVAERYFYRYEIEDAEHVSDPDCKFYASFGLIKGTVTQLFGLQSWIRGFSAGVINGHGIGPQLGDGFQMPGIFVIQEGEIKESFIHKLASDRPDYQDLVKKCCSIPSGDQ